MCAKRELSLSFGLVQFYDPLHSSWVIEAEADTPTAPWQQPEGLIHS